MEKLKQAVEEHIQLAKEIEEIENLLKVKAQSTKALKKKLKELKSRYNDLSNYIFLPTFFKQLNASMDRNKSLA